MSTKIKLNQYQIDTTNSLMVNKLEKEGHILNDLFYLFNFIKIILTQFVELF